jgi:hypothetical protein
VSPVGVEDFAAVGRRVPEVEVDGEHGWQDDRRDGPTDLL